MANKSRRKTSAAKKTVQSRQPQPKQQPQNGATGNEVLAQAAAVLQEASVKANPYEPMARLMQAFTPMVWFRPWIAAAAAPVPKLDVIDRDGSVLVRAEVPGVQKGRLAVEASDTAVTIKGEVADSETREGERYRLSETRHGMFERTVRMPVDVDGTRAKATFKDGVVEVMLPKVDRSRSHHVKF